MTKSRRSTRRRFLAGAAVLAATSLHGRSQANAAWPGADPVAQRLLSILRNRASARRVGEVYLAASPDDADVRKLLDGICGGGSREKANLMVIDDASLRRAIQAKVRRDFERRQTVDIQGWVMSVTEARLCALAALV